MLQMTKPLLAILLLLPLSLGTEAEDFDLAEYCERLSHRECHRAIVPKPTKQLQSARIIKEATPPPREKEHAPEQISGLLRPTSRSRHVIQ